LKNTGKRTCHETTANKKTDDFTEKQVSQAIHAHTPGHRFDVLGGLEIPLGETPGERGCIRNGYAATHGSKTRDNG
jgi:hypothetical protein